MICNHENCKIVLETKGSKLYRCTSCEIIFTKASDRAILDQRQRYADYYKREKAHRFGFILEMVVRMFRFSRAVKIFLAAPRSESVLDIGSGRGYTLYFLKKYFGFEKTVGTQINDNAYRWSKEKLGLEIYNDDLLDLSFPNTFDVITISHVLEHVENTEKYIQRISELLAGNGTFLIEVPNFDSWTSRLTREHWLALDLEHHITFFTPRSLSLLLHKYNLEIMKIRTFSVEYSTFTSIQSIMNLLTNTDSYFFRWLGDKDCNPKIIFHMFLFTILLLPCLLINVLFYFSNSGEVITVTAKKCQK